MPPLKKFLSPKYVAQFTHQTLLKLHSDSLHRNSAYLIASQLVLAVFGFFFWILNARLFTSDQIGIATTLISMSVLLTTLSQMGFNTATISYLPKEKDKNSFINTAFFIVSSCSVIFSIGFLVLIPNISKPLLFIRSSLPFMLFFVFFSIISSLNAITDSIFIALRSSKYIFFIDTVVAIVKLLMPILFIKLATYGIFYSYVVAVITGTILSIITIIIVFKTFFMPRLKLVIIKKVWKFSSSSYLANVVSMISSTITPILILNNLGPSVSAFYYMPSMIMSLMYTIPRSVSSSMMAEGSTDEYRMLNLVKKSLGSAYLLLIPAILGIVVFGKFILLAFGKQYSSEGFTYLLLSSISLLVVVPNYVLGTILNIRKASRLIISVGIINSIISVVFLLTFIKYGLTGVGAAMIITQLCLFLLYSIAVLSTSKEYRTVVFNVIRSKFHFL